MMNTTKSFYKTKRIQKIIATVLALVLFIGGGIILLQPSNSEAEVQEKKETPFEASLFVELTAKDIKESKEVDTQYILGSDIEVLNKTTKMADIKLVINKPTEVSDKLKEGTYELNMTSTPIEADGSTYKIPDKLEKVVVKKDKTQNTTKKKDTIQKQKDEKTTKNKKRINVEITLERIDAKDMTKEQLDVVITRIEKEAPGQYAELVQDLNTKKETAVSDAGSVKDLVQDSQATESNTSKDKGDSGKDTGKDNSGVGSTGTDTGGGSSGGGSSSGGSNGGTTPEKPAHTHSWVPQYVTHSAQAAQGYNQTIPAEGYQQQGYRTGDGKFFKPTEMKELTKYCAQTGTNYWAVDEWVETKPASSKWVETAPAKPTWNELVGYKCSCGASK